MCSEFVGVSVCVYVCCMLVCDVACFGVFWCMCVFVSVVQYRCVCAGCDSLCGFVRVLFLLVFVDVCLYTDAFVCAACVDCFVRCLQRCLCLRLWILCGVVCDVVFVCVCWW